MIQELQPVGGKVKFMQTECGPPQLPVVPTMSKQLGSRQGIVSDELRQIAKCPHHGSNSHGRYKNVHYRIVVLILLYRTSSR